MELKNYDNALEPVEITAEQADKKALLLGTYKKRIKNGKLFLLCLNTLEISEAEFEYPEIYDPSKPVKKKVLMKPNCLYVEAINAKNAEKKFRSGKAIIRT